MVVYGSADSNMRPIMKIASHLESKQGRWSYHRGAFHHGGKCFTSPMETWISTSTYRSWRNSYCQDDNARPYRAHAVVNFMETEGIEHMAWPAVSPDMNPTENMWSEVTRTMDASSNQTTNLANCNRQSLMHGKLCLFKPWQTWLTACIQMCTSSVRWPWCQYKVLNCDSCASLNTLNIQNVWRQFPDKFLLYLMRCLTAPYVVYLAFWQ